MICIWFLYLAFMTYVLSNINANDLTKDGANVCSRHEAYSRNEVRTFHAAHTEKYKTCCKKFLFCFSATNQCYKSRVVQHPFTKTITVAKLRTIYHCCNGWEKASESDHGCSKAICKPECRFGKCVRPNTCEYNPKNTDIKTIVNQAKCGQTLTEASKGNISLYGKDRNELLQTELCRWHVKVPTTTTTTNSKNLQPNIRISFDEFKMSNQTACAESMVSLRTREAHVFFFCSAIFPKQTQSFVIKGNEFVLEAIRSNWEDEDGFSLRYETEDVPN